MSREEIEKKIERVRDEIFCNQMNDHWSKEDYEYDKKKNEELKQLEKMLEELV